MSMFLRSFVRATIAIAFSSAMATGNVSQGTSTPPETRPVDQVLLAALEKAAAATPQKQQEFRSALQLVADRFESVQVGTTPGVATWNVVTLNRHGRKVDALRFRTPAADKLADFNWVVAFPKSVKVWYIAPAAGEMNGFREFARLTPAALRGHPVPATCTVISQQLPVANLRPDTDYILWFTFADAEPVEIHAAINFTRPVTGKAKSDVLKSFGL